MKLAEAKLGTSAHGSRIRQRAVRALIREAVSMSVQVQNAGAHARISRKQKSSEREAEQRRIQRQLSPEDDRVLTFNEWCALNGIGKRTGRRILTSGGGPVVTQLSERRIGITVGNNRRWQESRARS